MSYFYTRFSGKINFFTSCTSAVVKSISQEIFIRILNKTFADKVIKVMYNNSFILNVVKSSGKPL